MGFGPHEGARMSTDDHAECDRQIAALWDNVRALMAQFEPYADRFSTLNTPRWKRLVFRIDGWGPWHVIRSEPRWRPWRRWWRS